MGMTEEQAKSLFNSSWWKDRTPEDLVSFQLFEDRLCMPFSEFHKAIEKCLGRPVWTHEFAGKVGQDRLQKEFLKETPAPTFEEICNLIPEEKRIVLEL
jgi:hypothetical protein